MDAIKLSVIIKTPNIASGLMSLRDLFMIDKIYAAGLESLEVDLYKEENIPWDLLAFPVIRETLKYYYKDRKQGEFRIRTGEILREAGSYDFKLHT